MLTTRIPTSSLNRPTLPNSMSIHEAFARGCVNPVTLVVKLPGPNGAQFHSLESAIVSGTDIRLHPVIPGSKVILLAYLISIDYYVYLPFASERYLLLISYPAAFFLGLIHPKPSQSLTSVAPSAAPPNGYSPHTAALTLQRSQSMSGTSRYKTQSKYDAVDHRAALGPTLTQSISTPQKPHLINGVFYSANRGYIINSNGQVINLTNGDVLSIDVALRTQAVSRVGDASMPTLTAGDAGMKEHNQPAVNMMFNRVSIIIH